MDNDENDKIVNDIQNCILMFNELEESTAKINSKCREILRILNNPMLMFLKMDEVDALANGISFDLKVLGNFMNTFSEMYEEKGEEE